MKFRAICILMLACVNAQAAELVISGVVVDTDGSPVAGAVIDIGERRVSTGKYGRYSASVEADGPVALRIAADGYYEALHTYGPGDLALAEGDLGSITVVERKPGRQLLLFAGDAMLARRYFDPPEGEGTLVRRGHVLEDGKAVLETIKPYIELADLASVNMETQLSSRRLDDRLPKSVTFYSPPELAALLEWAGFDYVALGNNHTWDYQSQGLAATFSALGKTQLGYSGAGFDEATARAPWNTNVNDQPYAFLSYVGWAGTFSPHQAAEGSKGGAALGGSEVFAEDVSAVPANTTSVLQYHSGLEYSAAPAMTVRTHLREAVGRGADIAIAHHPHVLQGVEIHENRLIAYSMGNFLFDQTYHMTQLGMLLYVWMDEGELYRAEVVPLFVNGYVPVPATDAMRYAILHRLAQLSAPLGTCMAVNGAHMIASACDAPVEQRVDLDDAKPGRGPIPVARLGVSPARPVSFAAGSYEYRTGTDLLPHGDFEAFGQFGTPERGWIVGEQISIGDRESRHLGVNVPADKAVRTGMRGFHRVFTPSTPTTLSGRMYTDGPAVMRVQLQRRRVGQRSADELANGPIREVGRIRVTEAGWHTFSMDFDQPRISTHSLRLLIDVADDSSTPVGVEVLLDDLAWIEWRSPWIAGYNTSAAGDFATHVQFRPTP